MKQMGSKFELFCQKKKYSLIASRLLSLIKIPFKIEKYAMEKAKAGKVEHVIRLEE